MAGSSEVASRIPETVSRSSEVASRSSKLVAESPKPVAPSPTPGAARHEPVAESPKVVATSPIDARTVVNDLMKTHGRDVRGFCIRMLGDYSIADDVTQQVFLEAYRDLERSEIRVSMRGWLFGIANHRCLDLVRQRQRNEQRVENDESAMLDHADPGTGPARQLEQAQLSAALERCLRQLSPEVRATVLLRYQYGLSYDEIATQLPASAAALQVRVTRALPVLRRCLESKGWTRD